VAQAQTTTICQNGGNYPTQSINLNGVTNDEIVATNAFGVAKNGGSLCLDVVTTSSATATAGDFTVSTNTSTSLNYPNILKGQSYGEGPTTQSGMPIQVSQINSLPTGWDIQTPTPGSTEIWNNSIEFWLTTAKPTGQVNQANGTELMIWLGHSGGFNPYGSDLPTATSSSPYVTIGGIEWHVVGGRAYWGYQNGNSADQIYWNYIVYIPRDDVNRTTLHTDFKAFFDDAQTRTGECRTGSYPNPSSGSPDNATHGNCVYPSWWVTSVQAGFELTQGGKNLKSMNFTSMVNGVTTDRTGSDGRPIVNWSIPFDVTQAGCPNGGGSATYSVFMPPGTNPAVQTGPMTLNTANNTFKATVTPVYPNHGDAQLQIALTCPDSGTTTTSTNFYVDPSGVVTNSNDGEPIQGATVTLYYGSAQDGPFTAVPNGSTIMSPSNRRNPDLTGTNGDYGWNVQNNQWYKVRAKKSGCTSPTNPSIPYSESPAVYVPPAVLDLNIQLNCPTPAVKIVDYNDWGTGYCANVYVTNATGAPWVWTATFPIDGTIYNIWNATYTASAGQVSLRGIDWNRTLAVGATTQSVGFCANRSAPPPETPAVLVTKTADWGSGYCSTVTVTNNTSSAMIWNVTIPVQGTIYTSWNGVFTPIGGGQVSVHGVSWNASLAAGEKTHDVGFCANR
jgi:hypothetical protein